MNIEKLRRRRLRTGQVREKAESCAVNLVGKEQKGEGVVARPEKEEESDLEESHVVPGRRR